MKQKEGIFCLILRMEEKSSLTDFRLPLLCFQTEIEKKQTLGHPGNVYVYVIFGTP